MGTDQPSLQMNITTTPADHMICKPSTTTPHDHHRSFGFSSANSTITNLLHDNSTQKITNAEWPLMISGRHQISVHDHQRPTSSTTFTKPSLPTHATAPDDLELTLAAPMASLHQRTKTCSQGLLIGPIISVT